MSNSKNKFDPKPIKAVLDDIVGQKSLKKGIQNIRICNSWGEVMGRNILQYTNEVRFSHNTLYVSLQSAPLKMELKYDIDTLVTRINEHLGELLIQKIVLL
ncbi:MAG: hypothetical protein ACI9TK_000300 [Flavobacteriaceae bacterium]|jgi:hypothetical protein|tara:strand:- start:5041 stop:5343 length:303 start_codon:yes stop_codon:yes gene_type:complete